MIIDIHTHTFPEKIAAKAIGKLSLAAHCKTHTDASIPGLIRSMERSGVDRSVLAPVATSPQQVEKINDAAAVNCEAFENQGILSFGCIHPEYENYRDELARIQAMGLKGIKIHPVYQGMDIDDVRFLRILDRAAELGLVVLTHGGQDIGFPGVVHVSPAMCRHVMDQIGAFKLIVAHMGGWRDWEQVPEYLAGSGAMIDTSFSIGSFTPLEDGYWKPGEEKMLSPQEAGSLIRAMGAENVIFGSDSPWSDQAECIRHLKETGLSPEELALVLGENARKLLNL